MSEWNTIKYRTREKLLSNQETVGKNLCPQLSTILCKSVEYYYTKNHMLNKGHALEC